MSASKLGVYGFGRRLIALLPRRTQTRLYLVVVSSVALGLLEAMGLALVLPLLYAITDAAPENSNAAIDAVQRLARVTTRESVAAVLGAAVLTAFLTKAAAALVVLRWNLGVVLDAEANAAARLLNSYLRADYTTHLSRRSSDLIRNVNDSTRRTFQDGLTGLVSAGADSIVIAAAAVVLVLLQPVVACFAFGYFFAVAYGYQRLVHGRVALAGQSTQLQASAAVHVVQQSLTSVKEVKLYRSEPYFVARLLSSKLLLARANRTLLLAAQLPRYYLEVALVVGAAVLATASFLWLPTQDAVAVLGLFLAAAFRVLPSINRVIVGVNMVRSAVPAFLDICEDLATDVATDDDECDEPTIEVLGSPTVVFEDVSFSYGSRRVLSNITFRIDAGSSAAFIGPSGAGKSTILDLVLGLLPPATGRITIGGLDGSTARAFFSRAAAYVPQEIVLLDASVRENIALGVPAERVDEHALSEAIEAAALEDVVSRLPNGTNSVVGERGVMLSGGERQRVGIARALYRRPRLLVLDEATSSLDQVTERRIIDAVEASSVATTLLMVTHRLSTAASCSIIYVVEDGKISRTGTFGGLQLQQDDRRFGISPRDTRSPGDAQS